MFNLLDQLIEAVLDTGWTPTSPTKPGFSFTVPDDAWRTRVRAGTEMRLNIYLYEMRENREWRREAWDAIQQPDRSVTFAHPPVYFDCHYLISAWSPVEEGEATTPTLDEHEVLAEAMRVLLRNPEVTPASLGIGGGTVFQQAHIYLTLAAPDAPRVLNDFWNTMKLPWRPAIPLIATAPLDLLQETPPAPLVTTFIQRSAGGPGTVDEWIQIGGWVLRDADDTPVADAVVQRLTTGGAVLEEVLTDGQGRYAFARLPRGTHRLRAAAPGLTPVERDLTLPDSLPTDHIFNLSE